MQAQAVVQKIMPSLAHHFCLLVEIVSSFGCHLLPYGGVSFQRLDLIYQSQLVSEDEKGVVTNIPFSTWYEESHLPGPPYIHDK